MISLSKYQTERTTFLTKFSISSILKKTLLCKNVPFWQLCPLSQKVLKISFEHTRLDICELGVLTTLNFIGACNPKVYLIFVDPKSKISQKSDQN